MTLCFANRTAGATTGDFLPGVLQAKCDCGGPTSAGGGECEGCQREHAPGVMAKLAVGGDDDAYEQEAGQIADRVVNMPAPGPTHIRAAPGPGVHRHPVAPAARPLPSPPESVHSTVRASGRPLDPGVRAFFEPRFGVDFGHVRIHNDPAAGLSARDVRAHAYTVGHHVVFANGRYAPETASGRALLAHELTHVLQQQGTEDPARRTAPPLGSVQRQADPELEATIAEGSCDIGELCRLSRVAPEVVTHSRLMQAYTACHPYVSPIHLVAGNPCLTPNFGLPPRPTAPGPRRTPGGTTPGPGMPSPGGAASGGLSLPSTTIQFHLGPAAVTVDLPASLAVRLPVEYRGAERVVFALNASTSEFSFSITVNAVPHVRIIANARATTEGQGSAGLTIQTTRTTCQAVSPEAARSALQSAGTRLRDAIQAVQTPPPPDPEASELSRTFAPHARYAEVIGAVAKVKSEIDRVGAPCREVPVASFEFGVQGPLTTPEPTTTGTPPPASFIGGSLRFHF